jgi:hypothetical protein
MKFARGFFKKNAGNRNALILAQHFLRQTPMLYTNVNDPLSLGVATLDAPENLAVLRHIALNVLRQDTSSQLGIQLKRLNAAWDSDYLARLLFHSGG